MKNSIFDKTTDGKDIYSYELQNDNIKIKVLDFGANLHSLFVKNKTGEFIDVVLGYDKVSDYEKSTTYFGATIGRYGNRIANGRFTLNGKEHILAQNNGINHLHGGNKGFDKQIWEVSEVCDTKITFFRLSEDGEEGYSGNLKVYVTYELVNSDLNITYKAISDQDTPLSLTNHTYFNLNGGGNALEQYLKINADTFLANDENCLPTGEILPVKNTPFDFNNKKQIRQNIFDTDIQLKNGQGYDHNFCVGEDGILKHIATLTGKKAGISMETHTTEPGVQFYSGNVLYNHIGKNNVMYEQYSGICLETQKYPNSPNEETFPRCILKADTLFESQTIYRFSR